LFFAGADFIVLECEGFTVVHCASLKEAMRGSALVPCFLGLDKRKLQVGGGASSLVSSRLSNRSFRAQITRKQSNHSDLFPFAPLQLNAPPRRVIFGSCSSQDEDLSYWKRISALSPDLIMLMGDNVYGRREGLYSAYATLGGHCDFQQAARSIPIIATLDDNDYNYHPDGMDAAKGLFMDFFQVPSSDTRRVAQRGVYNSYVWADNQLQIICLDVRYHKTPFLQSGWQNDKGPYVQEYSRSSNSTMLGTDQWNWLEEQLQLDVRLRLICSPIQVLAEGHGWDCWNLMPRERDRLLSLVQSTSSLDRAAQYPNKTLFLTGDRHVAAFYQKGDFFEVTSSSLTHSVPAGLLDHEDDPTRVDEFVYLNNFGLLDIDWGGERSGTANSGPKLDVSIRRADNGELAGDAWTRMF
jgi:alkaline phosphatase D